MRVESLNEKLAKKRIGPRFSIKIQREINSQRRKLFSSVWSTSISSCARFSSKGRKLIQLRTKSREKRLFILVSKPVEEKFADQSAGTEEITTVHFLSVRWTSEGIGPSSCIIVLTSREIFLTWSKEHFLLRNRDNGGEIVCQCSRKEKQES